MFSCPRALSTNSKHDAAEINNLVPMPLLHEKEFSLFSYVILSSKCFTSEAETCASRRAINIHSQPGNSCQQFVVT